MAEFKQTEHRRKLVREAQARFAEKRTRLERQKVAALVSILRVQTLEEAKKIAEGALKDG